MMTELAIAETNVSGIWPTPIDIGQTAYFAIPLYVCIVNDVPLTENSKRVA